MKNQTKYWFLQGFGFVSKMGRWNLMKMCEALEMKQIKKGEEIHFNLDDEGMIYFLKSGAVKVVSKQTNYTKHVIKRGSIFGEMSLLGNGNDEEDKAIALKSGVVCFIDAKEMIKLMDKHSSLKNKVLKLNGLKIRIQILPN